MRSLVIIFSVLLVLFSLHHAQARIIHVPAEQSTIQAGINASVNGDTVLVAPGTYYEHISFYGKAILLKSQAGADSTIISKLYDGLSLVLFTSGEGVNSILDGFTIQNANNPNQSGGGIYCYDHSSPTIRNNIIRQNSANSGGGITCYNYSSPIVENNILIQNTASDRGGGIFLGAYSSPTIINNTFIRNSATYGGAISCLDIGYTVPTINGNTLIKNTAACSAGILCWGSSSPDIFDNTLDHNISNQWGSIACYNGSSPRIKNTIVSNDQSYGVYAQDNSFPVITFSDIWNNGIGNFFDCTPDTGCISADPIFCDTASDNYYLFTLSPCVGAGEGDANIGAFGIGCGWVFVTAGADQSGPANSQVSVTFYIQNIGAETDTFNLKVSDTLGWEVTPTYEQAVLEPGQQDSIAVTVSVPFVVSGTIDVITLSATSRRDSLRWDKASLLVRVSGRIIAVPSEFTTIQQAINASGVGDTLLVAPGTYYENINFNGKAILLKSEAGAESTIVDKLYGGMPLVLFLSGEDSSSVIEGFTLRNADNDDYGGAIYCYDSSPTIRNNILRQNSAPYGGGVACVSYSSPIIENNQITENRVSSSGGGISCKDHSSPTIRNNLITMNKSYNGGGVFCEGNCSPTITLNLITMDTVSGSGGGICCWSGSPTIEDNLIEGNAAEGAGGIYCLNGSPVITHNLLRKNHSSSISAAIWEDGCTGTISHNLLTENTAGNVGVMYFYQSSPAIINNTLDRNVVGSLGNIYCQNSSPEIRNTIVSNHAVGYGVYAAGGSLPTITYSDIWNNGSGNFYGCMPGEGCISADPLFCDTVADDYYLHGRSPCVGVGQGGVNIGAFAIGCGDLPYDVHLTPGSNKSGRAQTTVSVEFYVRNIGFLSDTYDLDITDSLGWTIVPTHYAFPLDSGKIDTATFTVSIPYVPIGTVDKLRLVAVSQIDPSVTDTAYLLVSCNAIVEGVEVTAGSNQSGYADSIVSIAYLVKNVGVVRDSYNLQISDTRGWQIIPLQYNVVLDTGQTTPVSFIVSITYVPLGTTDQLTLLAVSKTNSLARDSASLTVTCNAYVENWSISPGANLNAPAHSQVTPKFYIQNNGLARDSCYLQISDSLGWFIDPQNYRLSLNPGQRDSVFFNVQIPSVPVGTTNKIILAGRSLTNPYVADTTFLLVICSSYHVTITNISDVGNDQGKQVHIDWSSFPGSDPLVNSFSVFRRKDSLLTSPPTTPPADLNLVSTYPPGQWEWLVTIPAFGETLYSVVVPILKDSTIAQGMYWSAFFIRAGTNNPIVYFDSPVDSGYSLDNLSPSPPTGLFASHVPASTKLIWHTTPIPDFDYHTVYRDTIPGFPPSLNHRVGFTIDTTFIDSIAQLGRTYHYLVTATDFSGNESAPSNEAIGIRYITGDANTDGVIDVGDVVYLINYLFKSGQAPRPLQAGDANCDGVVDVGDVVYLINYLFKSGPPPSC